MNITGFISKLLSTVPAGLLTAVSVIVPAIHCLAAPSDSTAVTLQEISVTAGAPVRIIPRDGKLTLSSAAVAKAPALLGNPDPFRLLQTLPDVGTNNDFAAGISVNGMDYSQNFVSVDGMHIINPFHMLGLFSTFNTAHLSRFGFEPLPVRGSSPAVLGAVIEATSPRNPPERTTGTVTAGLINSSAAIAIPFGHSGNNSIAVALRQSYIDKIFPDLLKYDHARLLYRFGDTNLTYTHVFGNSSRIKASLFHSSDRMKMRDAYYDSDGLFKWSNTAAGITFSSNKQAHRIYWTRFTNTFDLRESTFHVSLPSSVSEIAYDGSARFGSVTTGLNAVYRHTLPQNPAGAVRKDCDAAEISASADWILNLSDKLTVVPVLRATLFTCGGFTRFYPMPRVTLNLKVAESLSFSAVGGRSAQFTHLIKESDTGLPANFWINASRSFRPQTSWFASLSADGRIADDRIGYRISAYYRSLRNFTEFDGSILNVVNSAYDPLSDAIQGNGRSYGISATISFRSGNFESWIAYNLGRSEIRIPEIADGYFPVNHDRRHDLNLTATYTLASRFHFSISGAYATGTPFTEAAYGYMIGENLVCEYYPHNSSRLPDYFRLDFAFGWDIARTGRLRHRLDISCYNLTAHNNVMLQFYHYSPDDGLVRKESSFRSVIPSISYTLKF